MGITAIINLVLTGVFLLCIIVGYVGLQINKKKHANSPFLDENTKERNAYNMIDEEEDAELERILAEEEYDN